MVRQKNMLVEVYQGRDTKLGFLCQTPEDVHNYLQPLLEEQYIQGVIDQLLEQRKNPDFFPNVVLFLDNNNRPFPLGEFIAQWKAVKRKLIISSGT